MGRDTPCRVARCARRIAPDPGLLAGGTPVCCIRGFYCAGPLSLPGTTLGSGRTKIFGAATKRSNALARRRSAGSKPQFSLRPPARNMPGAVAPSAVPGTVAERKVIGGGICALDTPWRAGFGPDRCRCRPRGLPPPPVPCRGWRQFAPAGGAGIVA